MNEADVKKIIADLIRTKTLKSAISEIYDDISSKLYRYYCGEDYDISVTEALDGLRNDIHFEIIPLYYQQHLTIEQIADALYIDVSTVIRNKKRLCLEIYSYIEE